VLDEVEEKTSKQRVRKLAEFQRKSQRFFEVQNDFFERWGSRKLIVNADLSDQTGATSGCWEASPL